MSKLYAKDSTLETFHAVVVSAEKMVIFAILSPIPQHPNGTSVPGVVCCDSATFTISAKVLARIKTEASHLPDTSSRPTLVLRTVCLRGIFDHDQVAPSGNFHDRIHIGRLTI